MHVFGHKLSYFLETVFPRLYSGRGLHRPRPHPSATRYCAPPGPTRVFDPPASSKNLPPQSAATPMPPAATSHADGKYLSFNENIELAQTSVWWMCEFCLRCLHETCIVSQNVVSCVQVLHFLFACSLLSRLRRSWSDYQWYEVNDCAWITICTVTVDIAHRGRFVGYMSCTLC